MRKFVVLFTVWFINMNLLAQDFSAINDDGVRIYYKYIVKGYSVEVTCAGYYTYNGVVSIPEEVNKMKVKRIGKDAFSGCSVTSVIIPNSVESIDDYAFFRCGALKSITIPNSVLTIGFAAFNESGLTSIIIPNSVEIIERSCFGGCKYLSSVTLSQYLDDLSEGLFSGCGSLKSITIPNNVKKIGSSAFENCKNISSIKIPDGVTRIGSSAFEGCAQMKTISIPQNVEYIGQLTFMNCTSLKSINLPNGIREIGISFFNGCVNLSSVTIPSSVTKIYEKAFYNCRSLKSITIPGNVTSIQDNAFAECTNLTSVIIDPQNTDPRFERRTIGNGAFNCENLMTIYCFLKNPIAIKGKSSDDRTFHIKTFRNATLYVPAGYIEKYKNTNGWKDFATIIETDPTDLTSLRNERVKIGRRNGRLTIDEAKNGEYIYVYSMDGKYIGSSVVHNGTAEIDIRMHTGNIFIVKIGNMVNKIVLN